VDADACGEGGEVGDLVCRERHGGGARVCVDACAATGAGPLGACQKQYFGAQRRVRLMAFAAIAGTR